MLCLKKRRTYSFTQGARTEPQSRRSASATRRDAELDPGFLATLPRKNTPRKERSSTMVLTVTEDTPADMLAGSMELLVQMPRDHHVQTQRVTVQRSTPMMDLLVQIATAHKLTASSYTLQAIGERGLVLAHQPNTPIGALDALQVKLLPKQGTFLPRKSRQTNQPFETTFRLQVHLPRNQLYVSRVSPKTNLGEILDEVCREKNLDRNKYELRHPANLAEMLDPSLSLQDYHLQEVTLCPRQQSRSLIGSALSSQDIMALQKQEECRRHQARQSVFGFIFKKSKESSLSTDSLGNRSVSPAHSDETARSSSPIHQQQTNVQQQQQQHPPPAPSRPQRKRRPAPKPPTQQEQLLHQQQQQQMQQTTVTATANEKDKMVISHSRNSSDSSGYHEASVLSDNPDSARMPETLPRRGKMQGILESPRKLAQTSQASKSLGNLAIASSHGGTLSRGISNTSLSSTGQRKKRVAPPPPIARPLPSAISAQGLERIVDSDESLTSDMDLSKPSSDIDVGAGATSSSKASSDLGCHVLEQPKRVPCDEDALLDSARVAKKELAPLLSKSRKALKSAPSSSSSSPPLSCIVEAPTAIRASAASCSSSSSPSSSIVEAASFGLPSLTEDEREEIAMAIDSIIEAAEGRLEEPQNTRLLPKTCDDVKSQVLNSAEVENGERNMDATKVSLSTLEVQKYVIDKDKPIASELIVEKTDTARAMDDRENENNSMRSIEGEIFDSDTSNEREVPKIPNELSAPEESESVIITNEHQDSKNLMPDYIDNGENNNEVNIARITSSSEQSKEVNFDSDIVDIVEDTKGPSCTIISTIPKCDHLEPLAESDFDKSEGTGKKRGKVIRSQSDMSNFDFGPMEKHARHLTSNGEVFTFALNPNLGEAATRRIEASIAGSGKSPTDILLQKVSDTLSHSLVSLLPPSPPPTPLDPSLDVPAIHSTMSLAKTFNKETRAAEEPTPAVTEVPALAEETSPAAEKVRSADDERLVTSSDDSVTVSSASQQDTSDYVSANGEDLSIGDWDYQIPAPPSAFRDDNDASPAKSTECLLAPIDSVKQPIKVDARVERRDKPSEPLRTDLEPEKKSSNSRGHQVSGTLKQQSPTIHSTTVDAVDFAQPRITRILASSQNSVESTEQKQAEVISELETKIHSNKPIVEPASRDESYAPKIAPVENNLSNFTITTYSRPKNLDIFEQVEQQQPPQPQPKPQPQKQQQQQRKQHSNDNRVISTYATLTRGRSTTAEFADDKVIRNGTLKNAQSMERMSGPLVDDRAKSERNGILREKPTVHRSKSYIILSSSEKFLNRANEMEKAKDEIKVNECPNFENNNSSKKFTGLTNVNMSSNDEIPRHKEKFSQWRDNILRKQEEPTKEKQLQSLQVLKSILPQLKNAQVTEENGYKNTNDNFSIKKWQDEPRDVGTTNSNARSEVQMRDNRRNHETGKRYTYCGPPSVSLGSWSERACVNVQIKNDTDYKLGGGGGGTGTTNSASGPRTVVSLNAEENVRKEPPATTTTLYAKETNGEDESRVDTTPVNFRELAKTFEQVELRPRPKAPANVQKVRQRHSEYIDRPPPVEILAPTQNGLGESGPGAQHNNTLSRPRVNGSVPSAKRYTSVVGIASNGIHASATNNTTNTTTTIKNNTNNNNGCSNGNGKSSILEQTEPRLAKELNGNHAVLKPPTMPIITGVTLKSVSARPKPRPATIQADPRDQLLESIRNFGGRVKLKSTSQRY